MLESISLDLYVDSMINDPISSMQSECIDSYPTHLLIHVDLFILLLNVAAMFSFSYKAKAALCVNSKFISLFKESV